MWLALQRITETTLILSFSKDTAKQSKAKQSKESKELENHWKKQEQQIE